MLSPGGGACMKENCTHHVFAIEYDSYFTVAASGDGGGYDLRDGARIHECLRPAFYASHKGTLEARPTPAPSPPSPRGTEGMGLPAVSRAHRKECPLPRDFAGSRRTRTSSIPGTSTSPSVWCPSTPNPEDGSSPPVISPIPRYTSCANERKQNEEYMRFIQLQGQFHARIILIPTSAAK